MAKRETVKVKAKLYDAVLEWINEQRVEFGLKPIKKIPDGYAGDGMSCPIAKGVGGALSQFEDGIYSVDDENVDAFITLIDGPGGSREGLKVHVQRGTKAAA